MTLTTDHSPTFELINDKAELAEAISFLRKLRIWSERLENPDGFEANPKLEWAWDTVVSLVPRLMASYEEALELTYTLANAWESYMDNQTPAGLYVP